MTDSMQALFAKYMEICNEAMEANKDAFPYKHMWEAAEESLRGNGAHVTVYDDDPKGDYNLQLHDKHLEAQENVADGRPGWRINKSYMREVVENAEAYIKDPSLLDWQWLKTPTTSEEGA